MGDRPKNIEFAFFCVLLNSQKLFLIWTLKEHRIESSSAHAKRRKCINKNKIFLVVLVMTANLSIKSADAFACWWAIKVRWRQRRSYRTFGISSISVPTSLPLPHTEFNYEFFALIKLNLPRAITLTRALICDFVNMSWQHNNNSVP